MRFSIVLLLFLSACSSNVKTLAELRPAGDDFSHVLAAEYQAYSESESEQGHLLAAEYYAGKGLSALAGKPVELDAVDEEHANILELRGELVSLLTEPLKKSSPQPLARAQLLFDCWQNELSRTSAPDATPCGEAFMYELDQLRNSDDVLFVTQGEYTLDFSAGSSKLGNANAALIKKIVRNIKHRSKTLIHIASHSKGSASLSVNAARLNAIKKAFIQAGMNSAQVHVASEDDSKKVFLSSDDKPAAINQIVVTVKTRKSEQGA